jgi:hypothetical protein
MKRFMLRPQHLTRKTFILIARYYIKASDVVNSEEQQPGGFTDLEQRRDVSRIIRFLTGVHGDH